MSAPLTAWHHCSITAFSILPPSIPADLCLCCAWLPYLALLL